MHLTSVWILINELCSFFLHADWMEDFRVIKKIENVTSDIRFLEECVRIGWIPNGFKWKFKAQGLKAEDDRKIECIKKDATLRIMDATIKALRDKKRDLEQEKERMIDRAWREKSGWDRTKWMKELDESHLRYREEAAQRKQKKKQKRNKRQEWVSGGAEDRATEHSEGNEEEEEREEPVVESWEMLVEEEEWEKLGREIFQEEESVKGRKLELQGLQERMEEGSVEVSFRTPLDGNCFYHVVAEQVGKTALEIRKEAVEYLRTNERINGVDWSGFVVGGERGKRAYLRTMANEGEWTDHVMIMATAGSQKRRIIIYSQTERTVIRGGEEEGEILLGYIRELHYFGVRRKRTSNSGRRTKEKEMGKEKEKKGRGGEGAVFNLGVEGLTTAMEEVLSLGLKFVPLQRVNKSKVEADIERLKVKLMWDVYWKWVNVEERQEGDIPEEERIDGAQKAKEREKERKFEGKAEKTPMGLPNRWRQAINKYCDAVKEDIYGGLKRRPKDNMSPEERTAMGELQERVRKKEWAVRPADKGGGITVEKYCDLKEDGFKELQDETTFEKRERSGLERISKEVEEKLKDMRSREVITQKMREFMSAKNKKEGTMKINRKVHKKTKENGRHPTRVYISGIGTPTEGIAGLVETELQEGVEKQKSYVQDTADFLRRLEEVQELQKDEFMFTMDVVALYPSVPREKTKEAMRENLDKRQVKKIPTEDLIELGEMVLRSNEFSFEGERYVQKEGTAIGSKMGKNYACTYMGVWEDEVQEKAERELGKRPKVWYRFVDDVWGIWQGSKEEFERFVEIGNSHEERIKVTYEVCEKESIFLDVKVTKMDGGKLKTELYVKPTDRTRYLHQDSDHPGHVKEGIAKGQFRRLRRICSEEEDYWKYGEMVEKKLTSRGYGENQVRRQMRETFKMGRKEALKRVDKKKDKRVNFVITHSGYLPNVNRILKRHSHYLEEDGLDQFIKELPRLSLRRGKNIGDLVVNAKGREEKRGSGPCGNGCKLCGHMRNTDKVKDKDGKELDLGTKIDCRTVGVIYGMHCRKCDKIVYVGKTKNRLSERFNGHRADMRMEDSSKPAFHFKREGHEEKDMGVIGLEHVPGNDDVYRITRERWWMNRMGTFEEENRRR